MKKILGLFLCLIFFAQTNFAQEIVLSGDITTDTYLTQNNTYLLRGFVRVQTGATLYIAPGTVIYGENSTQGSLVVKPGGKIMAEGTQSLPIVFTSEFTKQGSAKSPTYGDWGGIILLGNAPINVPGGTASIEGPGDSYGGTNADDNSGVMKYVRIEYPGIAFSLNNEINGLTFGGVGKGTKIEYVQVSYSGDDSFEWFGGNVNCKYLIAYRGWDDDFDTDFGYSGKLQYLLGVRDPNIADQSSSNGFESDNDGSGSTNEPRTSPTWYNITLIGPAAEASSTYNSLYKRGMHLRRSSQNKIYNALIMGWTEGLYIDGTNTVADAKSGTSPFMNSIISGSVSTTFKSTDATFQTEMPAWFTNNSGRTFTTNAEVNLADAFNAEIPNPMPLGSSPVWSSAAVPPNDGFFDTSANFVGAFGTVNWAESWSSLEFITVSVEKGNENVIPAQYELSQNYPNPFNPETTIGYKLQVSGYTTLKVYDILGKEVATLVNEFQQAGEYSVRFNVAQISNLRNSISSGVYFYALRVSPSTSSEHNSFLTKKMIYLK